MKRFGVRGRARYFGGGLMIVVLVALTLFVVLPALASDAGATVPPPSGAGITPLDVRIGGNGNCSNLFPTMAGVQELDVPNPVSGSYASGNGWNFTLTAGTLPGFNKNSGQSLAVNSNGKAAILGIGINGGTDSLIYDYRTLPQGWVAADTNLHAPASKFTSGTNPETGITQYYGISHLTVCYRTPLATISGSAYKDISGTPDIGGLTVTLKDTTSGGTQTTTTGSSGSPNYSFTAIAGDSYTVCISAPTFKNVQTVPATDTGSCQATTGTNGYSISNLSAGGSTGNNFGFQPWGSVSGTVYQDVNGPQGGGPDGAYEAGTDTTLQGWTVTLYDGSGNAKGTATSDANGQYSISLPFDASQTYTACVTPANPPGGVFAQSEPLPTAPNSCSTLSAAALQKGQQFTPSSAGANVTENFGVDSAVPEGGCPPGPPTPFGINNTGTGGSELQIQLAACKPNQTFVFNSGTLGDGSPFVSVWASDQTQPLVPLVEKVVFPDPIVDGAPKLQHIAYTDTFPYDPSAAQQMAFCKLDPRDPSDPNGMTLASAYQSDSTKSNVLPATNVGTSTPATSCVISLRTYVDASGNGWLEAYVYSDIDGFTKGIG